MLNALLWCFNLKNQVFITNLDNNQSNSSTRVLSNGSRNKKIKDYVFLDEFDPDSRDDFEELYIAIERDTESTATQEFFYPIDKDFEYDDVLNANENLRILIKHQLFKSKLNKEKFLAYKIKSSTSYAFDFTVGYIETHVEPENPSHLIVTRFYIYKIYRSRCYAKKAVHAIFKELFIRHYSINKLKVIISDSDLIMKRLLLSYNFKLNESKSSNGISSIKLVYQITREEIRKTRKSDESSILESLNHIKRNSIGNEDSTSQINSKLGKYLA